MAEEAYLKRERFYTIFSTCFTMNTAQGVSDLISELVMR